MFYELVDAQPHAVLANEAEDSRISTVRPDTASGAPLSVT